MNASNLAKSWHQRAFPRFECALYVVLVRQTETGFYRASTINLSQGGTCIACESAPFLESERVYFRLSNGPHGFPCLAGEAEVRWRHSAGERSSLGLKFGDMSPADQALLERLIMQHSLPGALPLREV